MSQENVERVRRIYDMASRRAWTEDKIREYFDPGVVIEENAAFPGAVSYRGYEGLGRWWAGHLEIYDEIRMEPRELIDAGDRVVARVHHWLVSKAGVELEHDIAHVWHLRDGRVVHATGYNERSEALEAVGLRE
jgi:ketosteroid isomerase-like protein